MQGCKLALTPMNSNEKLQVEHDSGDTNTKRYRTLIEKLIYLTHTKPNIAFSVGVLSRFMTKTSKHHLEAAKHVLRYLTGVKHFGLWYSRAKECNLERFSDSDWGGSPDDRKSTPELCSTLDWELSPGVQRSRKLRLYPPPRPNI